MRLSPFALRGVMLLGFLVATLFFISPPTPVDAAPVIYLRVDGDDVACNGTADASAAAAPNCAVATLAQALTLVDPGGTIFIGAGTFTGSAQIQITKNVTITGSGEGVTILRPGYNTGSSNPTRGWFQVLAGNTLNLQDLTMDGTGNNVFDGIRFDNATGNIERVTFQNISYSSIYVGTGLTAYDSVVNISESTFENMQRRGAAYYYAGSSGSIFEDNTYLGKGDGDFLDYAVEVSAGADIIIRNNTIQDNRGVAASDGSTSAGILISNFFNQAVASNALIESNNLIDNTAGVYIGYCSADDDPITQCDSGDISTATMLANRIVGNTTAGVLAVGDTTATAANNWWACNAGPGAAGCDSTAPFNNAVISTDPHLQLTAAVSTPTCNNGSVTGTITASLRHNSNSLEFGPPYVPDDIPVNFTVSAGTIDSSVMTLDGLASASFSDAPSNSTINFTISVDNETINASVDTPNCAAIPTPTTDPGIPPTQAPGGGATGGQPQIGVFDPAISKLGFLRPGQTGAQGERLEWVVTVSNSSGVAGQNLTVTDTLASSLRVDEVEAPGGSVSISGQTVSVSYPLLNPGQSVQFSIFTTVLQGGAVSNRACVSASNLPAPECATASPLTQLPSTGESPWWRAWLLGAAALLLAAGVLALLLRRKAIA